MTALTLVLVLASCGTGHPPVIDDGGVTSSAPVSPTGPAGQLAGLVAAAQDRRYVAAYTYSVRGRADRTVLASVAIDGSWRVDVPGGALGGGADVSIVSDPAGIFQCLLGGTATTLAAAATNPSPDPSASPSPPPPAPRFPAPACVKVASAGGTVPTRYDPVIEHIFTDWLNVLIDRDAPISVFTAAPLPRSTGSCFSIEPSAASLAPPIDAGIYCFTADGTMTAAKITKGTLVLLGTPAAAPPSNGLPAPVTGGPAAPIKAPPVPASTPSG